MQALPVSKAKHYKDAGTEFRNEKRMKKELISQRKRMKTD